MSTPALEDFCRRLQRAVQSQDPRVRAEVVSTIRDEFLSSVGTAFDDNGLLRMSSHKDGEQTFFHLNAFTGDTSHPKFAERLAGRMILNRDFREQTKPALNAHLFRLDPGLYAVPTDSGPTFLKVNHPVSGDEVIEHYLSDPNPEDPLVGLDVQKLTAPGGPAEIVEIRALVRWTPDDVKESKEMFDHQMGRGRSPTETPQFS